MQRLITSSTRAIRTSVERQLEVLREPEEQLTLPDVLRVLPYLDYQTMARLLVTMAHCSLHSRLELATNYAAVRPRQRASLFTHR